jgi:CDP-diacylglycerol--serine O-phosphatidyltransferase
MSPPRRRRFRPGRPGAERFRRRIHLLPHLFTLGNLFAGFFAVSAVLNGQLDRAALAIGAGIVLDGFDGAVARLVRSSSPMGVQLDSLADVVTFGLAPAMLAFAWGAGGFDGGEWAAAAHARRVAWIGAFAFLAACALRLARFNVMVEEPPREDLPRGAFIGMPTPTAAACVAVVVHVFKEPIAEPALAAAWAAALFLLAGLMLSRIPFPSPKRIFTNPPAPHLLLLGAALVLAAGYYYSEIVLSALLAVYLTVVVAFNVRRRTRRRD